MRVASLVLGIIGGIIGLAMGGYAISLGSLTAIFGGGEGTLVMGLVGFAASIIGIVAGGVAWTRPRAGTVLFVVAIVVGLAGLGVLFIPSALLFIPGAITAHLGRRELQSRDAHTNILRSEPGQQARSSDVLESNKEPTEVQATRYCPSCGTPVEGGFQYCPSCGKQAV